MDTQQYKIGIVGIGPVGMILAVHLKHAGCIVTLCDNDKEKNESIKKNGINLTGVITKTSYFDEIYNSCDKLLDSGIDILISCVKTYRVNDLLKVINKYHKELYILSAQNGIDIGQKYMECVDESKILRMIVNFAGNIVTPDTVKVTFSTPPHYIASINDTCTDLGNWIASILTFIGQETLTVDSFKLFIETWKKTIFSSSISPLCGLSKLTVKEAMQSSDTIEVIEQTILEAMQVAQAEGIKFEDNYVKLCLRNYKNAGDHFPSLGVDILHGGETEIDYNNGKIVEYGRKHYIQTPLNLTFTNLVNAVSKKNLGVITNNHR
ncbi:MAG: ketopantoate reductase C-terminal domain-containing protein [bacterium]